MCISQTLQRRPLVPQAVPSASLKPIVAASNAFLQQEHHHRHHVVKHNYHDHSKDAPFSGKKPVARGGVTTPFPVKLHDMLDVIEQDGYGHVVSWQPHGRCFVVHKPQEFCSRIMPTYFNQSKFASFQRQLNLYGFVRLTKGRDKGGYYHELFLRGKPFLCQSIQRMKVKGTGVRARSNPETEPDFYSMPPVESEQGQPCSVPSMEIKRPQEQVAAAVKSQQPDDDDVIMFEGRPFHYLDPFVDTPPTKQQPQQESTVVSDDEDQDPFSRHEMEHFLHDLNLPSDLYHDIMETVEDDEGLGNLLERIID